MREKNSWSRLGEYLTLIQAQGCVMYIVWCSATNAVGNAADCGIRPYSTVHRSTVFRMHLKQWNLVLYNTLLFNEVLCKLYAVKFSDILCNSTALMLKQS